MPLLTKWLAVDEVREEAGVAPEVLLADLARVDDALAGVAASVYGGFAELAAARV